MKRAKPVSSVGGLVSRLAEAKHLNLANEIVAELEELHGCSWRAVGGRENNYGQINIGSDPGFALIERVTNAIDSIIEYAAVKGMASTNGKTTTKAAPSNPREAVERWFSIASGRVRNLKQDARQLLAEDVTVSLLTGSAERSAPTIAVRDRGIGLSPEQFPKSILGLGESNKIDKPFLAGAYGQGGSTTFAFSPHGTVIASRRQPSILVGAADRIAVTFVRFRDLDPRVNKNGRYEYLVGADGQVPSLSAADLSSFHPGTQIVHFDYDLARYSSALTQVTGSLWWLLQNALFDPVLPIWAEDLRSDVTKNPKAERRSITGNHTRLWNDRRSKLEHSDSVQIVLPHPEGSSRILAHYWVAALPEDKSKKARPIEAYVDPFRPVAYTFYGQTHGYEDARFVRERMQLPYLDRYLILQVELDHLTPHARRAILSTTRDRLKESHLYDELRERLAIALAEDPELIRINEERKEALLASYSETERQKMRERFARLLENLQAGTDALLPAKGNTDPGRAPSKPHKHERPEALPTADEPSFIRIANAQRPVLIQRDRSAILRLESDAPDGYLADHDPHARLVLSVDPAGAVLLDSRSDFKGGRARVIVRPASSVPVNTDGSIDLFLLTPSGESLHDRVGFRVVEPDNKPGKGDSKKGLVKAPEPVPIHKDQWAQLGWDEGNVALVEADASGARILVNMDNRHITRLLQIGGYKETGLQRMKNSYLLYTAYYAWLQHQSTASATFSLAGEDFEQYQAGELDRASQTVISTIAAEGRLE